MNKKLTKILIASSIAVSLLFNTYHVNKTNRELVNNLKQEQKQNKELQKKYDSILKSCQTLENDNEKLNQEIKNLVALREKTRKEQALSRGLSQTTYDVWSRVDVKTGITANLLNKAFVGTKMEGLGQAFVDAEQKYDINAIFLASIAVLESGWGTSDFARNRNNLFGFGSLDDQERECTVRFNSKEESVMLVAKTLRRDYLNQDGIYFNGATPTGINKKYCSSSNWKNQVASIMNLIVGRATK